MQVHQPSSQELNTPEYPGRGAVSTPAVLIQGVSDGSAIPDRAQALREIRYEEMALLADIEAERDPLWSGHRVAGSWFKTRSKSMRRFDTAIEDMELRMSQTYWGRKSLAMAARNWK